MYFDVGVFLFGVDQILLVIIIDQKLYDIHLYSVAFFQVVDTVIYGLYAERPTEVIS